MSHALETRAVDVQKLLERAKAGAPEALGKLVELHQQPIRIYLARLVRRPEVVDDLAQEVFLTAFRSLGDHTNGRPFLPWLMGIARHRALHYLRSESRRQHREGVNLDSVLTNWRLAEASSPRDPTDLPNELAALRDCLEKLPPRHRDVVREYYFEDHTAAEIGGRLGRTPSGIRMLLLRVRTALAECVQNERKERR
jgi:RNA polymerase sigma-70 factor, ECF subfamily